MTFGQQVRVKATLRRRGGYNPQVGFGDCRWWDRVELKAPRIGLFIGRRTLVNGTYYYEDGFTGKENLAALLVVFDERSKPVFARPEDVEEVSE